MSDQIQITSLDVGHGDAILIQNRQQDTHWTGLIDGGSNPTQLSQLLQENKVENIDLLILTHLDTDHVGGLLGIPDRVRIAEYWGPCLPAFSRYQWLFGARGNDAIRRGTDLEAMLIARGTEVVYPLDGFQSSDPKFGTITVLSPAAKLIRRLLFDINVGELIGSDLMPLDWITAPDEPNDNRLSEQLMEIELARGALSPEAVAGLRPLSPADTRRLNEIVDRHRASSHMEPDFFGDSLLNNTGLVTYFDCRTGNRRHRSLFAGDLEDWTYVLARNPRGLQADILKASHHGGEVRVGPKTAHDEILASVQPRVVLFCADGSYDLPHNETRTAAARWGASVFCSLRRNREFLGGTSLGEKCCCKTHHCTPAGAVRFTLSAEGIQSESPACHSGFDRGIGPIVRIEQHVVEPSTIVNSLQEGELRRHIAWAKNRLRSIHDERRRLKAIESKPVPQDVLISCAEAERRYHFVASFSEVVKEGIRRHSFWANRQSYDLWELYAAPPQRDVDAFELSLRKVPLLLFELPEKRIGIDPDTLLELFSVTTIASHCEEQLLYPNATFKRLFWPDVSHALKRQPWKCFVRHDRLIAFTARDDIFTADVEVLNSSISRTSGKQSISIGSFSGVPASVALVETKHTYTQPTLVGKWLSRYGEPERFWAAFNHDADNIASALTETTKQLW